MGVLTQDVQNRTVPRIVPTQCRARFLDRSPRAVFPRVDVPFRDRHVAVADEIREHPRVHERRPARETSVPKSVEREVQQLRRRVCFRVSPLERRRLDVPCGRKHSAALLRALRSAAIR